MIPSKLHINIFYPFTHDLVHIFIYYLYTIGHALISIRIRRYQTFFSHQK